MTKYPSIIMATNVLVSIGPVLASFFLDIDNLTVKYVYTKLRQFFNVLDVQRLVRYWIIGRSEDRNSQTPLAICCPGKDDVSRDKPSMGFSFIGGKVRDGNSRCFESNESLDFVPSNEHPSFGLEDCCTKRSFTSISP